MDGLLSALSDQMADTIASAAPSVVQVQGQRRPASGLVYAAGVVVTTGRAIGREDQLRVRSGGGQTLPAELAGWDQGTGLAVLRVADLDAPALVAAEAVPRVGQLGLAVARTWSNGVVASAGIVSVIGGQLPTGRRQVPEQVIRTTAPMHEGFACGAFVDIQGRLLGLTTAATIRGLGVVVPVAMVWRATSTLLEHGTLKQGYLGLAGQPAVLPEHQRTIDGPDEGLLIVGITSGSPAEEAGLIVGDVVVEFDGEPIDAPERLLDLIVGDRVGQDVAMRVLRGGESGIVTIRVAERPRE